VDGNEIQCSKRAISKPLLGDVFMEYGRCSFPTPIRTFDREHWPHAWLLRKSRRLPKIFLLLTTTKVAYIVFELFLFGSAFADNFATLVVTRFFGGGASSVSINIVGGSISDVWKGDKARSLPMSIFGFTSVAGIALGPFMGSAIVQIGYPSTGLQSPWRWFVSQHPQLTSLTMCRIYYIQIIYNAALIPVFYIILKETRGDVILKKRAQKIRKETGREVYAESELEKPSIASLLKVSFMRPTRMLFTEPVVTFFTLWISFAWGILFLFFSSVVQTFNASYGFGTFQTGLIQLAITVGALIGTLINPLQDWMYLRTASKNQECPGRPIPEGRLYTSIPGSLLFTAGLFLYGWTCRPEIHWIVPAIGVCIVGVGIYSIYMGVVNYLTDAYEKYAASALSAASLGRNTFGAFLPFASYSLFQNLGFGWAGSLLGFVGLALSLVPVVLLLKGRQIRAKSFFMSKATFDDGDVDEETEYRKNSTSHRGTFGPAGVAGGPPGGVDECV
jgi:MFS family permease